MALVTPGSIALPINNYVRRTSLIVTVAALPESVLVRRVIRVILAAKGSVVLTIHPNAKANGPRVAFPQAMRGKRVLQLTSATVRG
jgi:hypothetical protein